MPYVYDNNGVLDVGRTTRSLTPAEVEDLARQMIRESTLHYTDTLISWEADRRMRSVTVGSFGRTLRDINTGLPLTLYLITKEMARLAGRQAVNTGINIVIQVTHSDPELVPDDARLVGAPENPAPDEAEDGEG